MKTKMSIPQRIWAYVKGNPIVVMMALVSLIVGCTINNFFSLNNFNVLMGNTTIRFLIALGVSGCLITKGTDLSAGRQAALAATLTGVMVQRMDYAGRLFTWMPEMNMWVTLLVVLAIGACIGLITGSIIAYLKVPPFIATLGTQLICRALCKLITPGPVSKLTPGFRFLGNGKVGPFHMIVIVMIIMFIILAFMLKMTRFGKSVYAVGGNDQAARVAGINVEHTLVKVYMWCSLCAALGGVLLAGRSDSADPANTGLNYELDAIAAATVGGTSQTGGICRPSGVIAGILIMGVINNGMVMMGVNDQMTFIVKGLIIIGSVAFDMRKNAVKK